MKLSSIQLLRAFAVLLIVYAHSIGLTRDFSDFQDFYFLGNIGFLGQDLFFVISGFIIPYTAMQYIGLEEGVQFLQKRFFRINPIYYIASLLFIGCHVLHIWISSNRLPIPISVMLTSFADTLLVIPTTAEINGFKPLLVIGWTLTFGWIFYILFFISILTKIKRKIPLLVCCLIILSVSGVIFQPSDLRLSILTNPILLEFVLGMLICQLYLHRPGIPVVASVVLVLAGIAWYIFLVFYGYGNIWNSNLILNGSLSLQRALLWGVPAGCIVTGCIFLEKAGKMSRLWHNQAGRLLGNASYSIYLMHLSAFSLIALFYRETSLLLPPDVGIYLQVIIAVLISLAFYWWVDRPLLRWLNKPSHLSWLNEPSTHTQPV